MKNISTLKILESESNFSTKKRHLSHLPIHNSWFLIIISSSLPRFGATKTLKNIWPCWLNSMSNSKLKTKKIKKLPFQIKFAKCITFSKKFKLIKQSTMRFLHLWSTSLIKESFRKSTRSKCFTLFIKNTLDPKLKKISMKKLMKRKR